MEIMSNPIILLAITFGIYYVARQIQKWTGWIALNPILITIAALIALLQLTGISYETYEQGGQYIDFWLKPAIVALGVPLYQHLGHIRRQLLPILLSQLVGCLVGLVCVTLIASAMGASHEVIVSLAPKSVTTPIAMEVCRTAGGIPSLTAAIVVITGLIGAIIGFKTLSIGRVNNPMALGLSMGAASHAIGTSAAMERDQFVGAYASLGLTLNGILTALLTPTVIELIG